MAEPQSDEEIGARYIVDSFISATEWSLRCGSHFSYSTVVTDEIGLFRPGETSLESYDVLKPKNQPIRDRACDERIRLLDALVVNYERGKARVYRGRD